MENNQEKDNKAPKFNFSSYWIYGIIILILLGINVSIKMNESTETIDTPTFEDKVKAGEVDRVEIINKEIVNVFLKKEIIETKYPQFKENAWNVNQPQFSFRIGDIGNFEQLIRELKTQGFPLNYKVKQETNYFFHILNWLLPFALLLGLWLFIMRRVSGGGGGPGGQIFNIGKSKATLFDNNTKVNVTFADVAGLNEAKVEVMEVVDFLKNPKKYTALGGKIPKGVLLVGPPGTGKTLLAKAVAGEAGVPFFSISGSDFVEMFVGVGASRVRDLFKQAREKAPDRKSVV